jgi:hypothetical protein
MRVSPTLYVEMQPDEQREEEERHVPHGALADLCDRADQIRQAYDDLRGARTESDPNDQQ